VAAKHGANVTSIDSSRTALEEGQRAAERNGIEGIQFVEGDCFDTLKAMVEKGEKYEGVILDPPRFAGSRHQIDRALRAYAKLNSLAVDLLLPGGVLATCSCSGRVSRSDFLNMLMDVAKRKRRDLIVLENRGPAPDHPVSISCPESDYLKCVILQVG
jgi:23S rRNA (cytosine1962-C5)-methyltransferase